MRVPILVALWGPLVAACGGQEALGPGGPGGDGTGLTDAGTAGCLSSNECPAGYVLRRVRARASRCRRRHPDAGATPPPEIEYELGAADQLASATSTSR